MTAPEERRSGRVVVTGMGCVCPSGEGVLEAWESVISGRSAVSRISAFDASGFPVQIAAECKRRPFEVTWRDASLARYADRKVNMAVIAAEEALAQAGFDPDGEMPEPSRFGVSVGTENGRPLLENVAGTFYRFRDHQKAGMSTAELLEDVDPIEFVRTTPHLTATMLSMLYSAHGSTNTCSTACTSSAQSVGEAALEIRRGHADVMLAGGTDALVEGFMVAGFALLGALSQRNDEPERASRPFDKDRDGFVLGEGAGFLILESLEHALGRGADILAEFVGYGCSSNAYRITDSPPDGRGAFQSMSWALRDAKLAPESIGYINAHGTSTMMNDSSETRGIIRALGDHAFETPVSSTKSMMGHLVAACGAVESIICVQAIREGVLPPTINYETPDPACNLDYVPNTARDARIDYAMSNSFGFGGSNGSLIFGRYKRGTP